MKTIKSNFIINGSLILISTAMIFSGLYLQIKYHLNLGSTEIDKEVPLAGFLLWSNIHTISSLAFSMFIIIHIYMHRKWFQTIYRKKLLKKNRRPLILSLVTIVVAITALVAWISKITMENSEIRTIFVEIHDKIAVVLIVLLFMHVIKRKKWYFKTYRKLNLSN